MTAPEAEPAGDPSMEDILASIRRILADGEGGEATGEGVAPPHAAAPAPGQPAGPAPDSVFLLDRTMLIEEPAAMPDPAPPAATSLHATPPDPSPPDSAPAGPMPAANPPEAALGDDSHLDAGTPAPEPLLAASAAAAATASLGALVRVVGERATPVYRGGPTLEDMVREEIRPLVKAWLDQNLAPMVERLVRTEIERVTRS